MLSVQGFIVAAILPIPLFTIPVFLPDAMIMNMIEAPRRELTSIVVRQFAQQKADDQIMSDYRRSDISQRDMNSFLLPVALTTGSSRL